MLDKYRMSSLADKFRAKGDAGESPEKPKKTAKVVKGKTPMKGLKAKKKR